MIFGLNLLVVSILEQLKSTSFFKALSPDSQQKVLREWRNLSAEQVEKIMVLVAEERAHFSLLAKVAKEMLQEENKSLKKRVVKKVEKASRHEEALKMEALLKSNFNES